MALEGAAIKSPPWWKTPHVVLLFARRVRDSHVCPRMELELFLLVACSKHACPSTRNLLHHIPDHRRDGACNSSGAVEANVTGRLELNLESQRQTQ